MKINSIFSRLCLGAAIAVTGAVQLNADTIEVFGDAVTDLSAFDTVSGNGSTALVSVVGGAGAEQLSFLDNANDDAAEAYLDFGSANTGTADGNVTNGVRVEFDVSFNNTQFDTLVSDPEVVVRLGNAGANPTGGQFTGFQLNFRHETDDSTNQIRATNLGSSSTSSGLGDFVDLADGTSFNIVAFTNNDIVSQDYTEFGGGTVAAGTYDLYIDGVFIQNYTLGDLETDADTGEVFFDPTVGFGTFGIRSSSNSDLGVEVLFDNIRIGLNEDNGFSVAVPEPSSAILLLGGLFSLGLIRRRN